jgi:sec-independent protein translocase protein TatB
MDFFGIGLPEIILILVLLLIVVGPKRLPELAVQLARLIRQGRRYASEVTGQLRDEMGDLTKDYDVLREELRQLREDIDKQSRPLREEVEAASSDLKASAAEIEKTARGQEEKPHEAAKPPSEGEG